MVKRLLCVINTYSGTSTFCFADLGNNGEEELDDEPSTSPIPSPSSPSSPSPPFLLLTNNSNSE